MRSYLKHPELYIALLMLMVIVVAVLVMPPIQNSPKNIDFGDNYQKMSVDDTPLMIITDKDTQCRYVYDTVSKTLSTAIGYEKCLFPNDKKESP